MFVTDSGWETVSDPCRKLMSRLLLWLHSASETVFFRFTEIMSENMSSVWRACSERLQDSDWTTRSLCAGQGLKLDLTPVYRSLITAEETREVFEKKNKVCCETAQREKTETLICSRSGMLKKVQKCLRVKKCKTKVTHSWCQRSHW